MPKATPKKNGTRSNYKKVFRNKKVLEEMLTLARLGASFSSLARKYRVDHTSIMHRCRVAGIKHRTIGEIERDAAEKMVAEKSPFLKGLFYNGVDSPGYAFVWDKLKQDIIFYIKEEKMSLEKISSLYCITVTELVDYCHLTKLNIVSLYADSGVKIEEDYFTEDGYPRWRKDVIEGRICLGKTQEAREIELKKRELDGQMRKRKDLLSY